MHRTASMRTQKGDTAIRAALAVALLPAAVLAAGVAYRQLVLPSAPAALSPGYALFVEAQLAAEFYMLALLVAVLRSWRGALGFLLARLFVPGSVVLLRWMGVTRTADWMGAVFDVVDVFGPATAFLCTLATTFAPAAPPRHPGFLTGACDDDAGYGAGDAELRTWAVPSVAPWPTEGGDRDRRAAKQHVA